MNHLFKWLNDRKDAGIFLLRLFIGLRLIYGVVDNVLHWERMIEFSNFLEQFRFPFPLLCAVISVYAQLIAGVMITLGWKIRYAALLMVINFSIAFVMVDRKGTVESMTPALAILFCSILFLFQGSGQIAVEKEKDL